jgi:hypothetical protein
MTVTGMVLPGCDGESLSLKGSERQPQAAMACRESSLCILVCTSSPSASLRSTR